MRRVKDAVETVHDTIGTTEPVSLYACEFSDYETAVVTGGESCRVVAKVLRVTDVDALSIAVYRWLSEIYMHRAVYKRFPSETLELVDAFFDDARTFVIIYERAHVITRAAYEERIAEVVNLVVRMNAARFYHLDTKPANFLQRSDGGLVLHDWGSAASMGYEDEIPFDLMRLCADDDGELDAFWKNHTENIVLLFQGQMRLVFTGYGSPTVPRGIDNAIVGLPTSTMYRDEHYKILERFVNASQPMLFDRIFTDLTVKKCGQD